MTISTATVLENNSALSEFTAAAAAPAPASPVPALSVRAVVRTVPVRRVHIDWYTLSVLLLILASGAVCLYRLAWAMQP